MSQIVPVILCGGSGTRLWPLSRKGFPKQFLVLSGTKSLFQQAVERIRQLKADDISIGETLVVTNEEHRFLALDQLRDMGAVSASLLLEPVGRNTAPALTLAALHAAANGEDPILVVTPADQTIKNSVAFITALRGGVRAAAAGTIVILGVKADRPETGYGYIKYTGVQGANGEYTVAQFAEKPNMEAARSYVASGNYAWNSGMFVLRASSWLNALKNFRPDIAAFSEQAWAKRSFDTPFIRPDKDCFYEIPSDSIDYSVMEHCPGSPFPIKMVPLDAGWSDLGAWNAVWQAGAQDSNGNVIEGDAVVANTSNTLVYASNRLVGAVGVSDLVIVETADAVLVTNRCDSQNVKALVSILENENREEHTLHRKVHRPWGWYDSIDEDKRFKVKRIEVKPGASLSLQKHHHRAEHWIIVQGTAEVTCGSKTSILAENQSTYVAQGETHRLSNPGRIPLVIIEVQTGTYLGEDDIVRLEDNYGRSQ